MIDGYMKNASGYLVPISKVSELEIMRDELVKIMAANALALQQAMQTFKQGVLDDIYAFVALSAERFDVQLGGEKGNISLLSYDGRYKVLLAIQQNIIFDENIHAAKAIIDECLHRWTQNSDDNVKALIEHAFRVDSQGNIRTSAVLNLFKLKIDDDRWLQAMNALKASLTPSGSKSYIRFYQRVGDEGKFEQISLDIAGL
ncbi:MAG: DUF3164 family protein [Methylococcales bacterium]|nr:DUF3164 family protein [Methylococcales bacterium]